MAERYKNDRINQRSAEEESSIDLIWEKTEKSVKKMVEEVLGFQGK